MIRINSLECCTKTHTDDLYLHSYFSVVISAFPCYFVAFCQRFIYEYMDMEYGYESNRESECTELNRTCRPTSHFCCAGPWERECQGWQ